MKKPPETLKEGENMTAVMEKFDTTRSWYLPVLDHERKLLGFVSKSVLFAKYREALSAAGDLYE
jgi:CIC family chloride channel protein